MIIVVKDKEKVYLAQTIIDMENYNFDFDTHIHKNNSCLWKMKNHKNCIVAVPYSDLFSDLIRHNTDIFEENIDIENLIQKTIPKLTKLAKAYKCYSKTNEFPHPFIVAQNEKAYIIYATGFVCEIDDFEVMSNKWRDLCYGSLSQSKGMPALSRIKKAVNDFSAIQYQKPTKFLLIDTKME